MKNSKLKPEPTIRFYLADTSSELEFPFMGGISAGFPSPALDFTTATLDLGSKFIKHPNSTFYGEVCGHSMRDEGVEDGDILVIDKSLEPRNGSTAVCFIDGAYTLKKIQIKKGEVFLMPANPDYEPIRVTEENEFIVWGIVTYIVKKMGR